MKLYEVIAAVSLTIAVLSARRSPAWKAAAPTGLAGSTLAIRWLPASGSLPVRHVILFLGMPALAAGVWIDYCRGCRSTGVLVLLTLLFGLLPLVGLARLLVFRPDQLAYQPEGPLMCALALPCGISSGICLFCTLRRERRGASPDTKDTKG